MNPSCKFCQRELSYVPLTIKYKSRTYHQFPFLRSHVFEVHYCFSCGYELMSNTYHLYKSINNKTYRWDVGQSINGDYARLWYVETPGIPGKEGNKGMKLLKTFDKHFPIITPDNIENKLKFILLFL